MEEKARKQFKMLFNTTTAAFSFVETLLKSYGKELPDKSLQMYALHLEGKAEMEKENPDIFKISAIIQQCEILAGIPEPPKILMRDGGLIVENLRGIKNGAIEDEKFPNS